MCGIYGWSFKKKSKIPAGQREVLASSLAVANSLRGDQSWGIYLAGAEGKRITKREVGDVARVSGIGAWGSFPAAMGHTRYATTGKITVGNSHPFKHGSILLAHNGVVYNHDELNKKLDRKCEVDSQHFAIHLSENKPFDDIEGYGAIEWVEDSDPRAIHLARLRGGSLHAYGVKNAYGAKVGVVWSSDEAHLKSALGAARLDCYPFEDMKEGQIYQASEGGFYVLNRPLLKLAERSYDAAWEARWKRWTNGGSRSSTMYGGLYGTGVDHDYDDPYSIDMTTYYREKYGVDGVSESGSGTGVWVKGEDGVYRQKQLGSGKPFAGEDAVEKAHRVHLAEILKNDLKYEGDGVWVDKEGTAIDYLEPEDEIQNRTWLRLYGTTAARMDSESETSAIEKLRAASDA